MNALLDKKSQYILNVGPLWRYLLILSTRKLELQANHQQLTDLQTIKE